MARGGGGGGGIGSETTAGLGREGMRKVGEDW